MTESLFDTNFTSENESKPEPTQQQQQQSTQQTSQQQQQQPSSSTLTTSIVDQSSTLPSLQDKSNIDALINYRVLVSAKEAGCLIGTNGQVIDSIRNETNTKAGISRLIPGSHERILTVLGKLDDCAKALSYFAQALINANIESYNFFPLKQLSSTPNTEETTILRLLIPNSQMGTLIGSKGARIQQLQNNFNISMIASKSFLPGSNERLVELQGTVDDLYDSLRIISRCLIEDFSSIVGTTYYVPRGNTYNNNHSHSHSHNNNNNTNNNNNNNNNNNTHGSGGNKTTDTISFPNDIVGALIGKRGSRIDGVRKVSGAMIAISEAIEGENERVFTITGSSHAVDKAKQMIYQNFKREEERRKNEESRV